MTQQFLGCKTLSQKWSACKSENLLTFQPKRGRRVTDMDPLSQPMLGRQERVPTSHFHQAVLAPHNTSGCQYPDNLGDVCP